MNTTLNTPAHCHDCNVFADCRQAQNMMADTPPVEGFVYDGEVYCFGCIRKNDTPHKGESDFPVHCAECGVLIIHDLTIDGVEYIRDNLDGCTREVWPTVWGIKPKIPVDSIVISDRFVRAIDGWEGSESCMLRAITSTGNLTIGTHRPRGCDTDEKWYLTIWRELSADLACVVRMANNNDCDDRDDFEVLAEFEAWTDEQIERLEESYGLAEWDPSDD